MPKTRSQVKQTNEASLTAIVASALDGNIASDSNCHIAVLNSATERMFGLIWEQVLGTNLDRLLPSIFGLHADGSEFPIDASISQSEVNGKRCSL
jgi:signal transduction histidine kinase